MTPRCASALEWKPRCLSVGSVGDWSPTRHLVMPCILIESLVWRVMSECGRKSQAGVGLGPSLPSPKIEGVSLGLQYLAC